MSAAKAVGIAASLAAMAAAGYFVFGPQGKKNRKMIKGWTLKMKGEVLEKIEKLKEVTPEVYHKVIDEVSAKYAKVKDMDMAEVEKLASDMKKHWSSISRDLAPKVKKAVKKVTKAVKKATK